MQVIEARVSDDLVQVAGDGSNVLVDGPLVVVENDDEPARAVGDVVQCFVGNTAGEGGIAGEGDYVFLAAHTIAGNGHTQRGGQGGTGVSCAIAVVRALAAQHETIQAARGSNGVELLAAPSEELVDVGLVADVKDEVIGGGVEHVVHGEGELDNAEVGAEVPAVFGKHRYQFLSDVFGEHFQLGDGELFYIEWGINRVQ